MDMNLLAVLGILTLFLFMFLRMPISFTMFIVGFIGLIVAVSPKAAFNVLSADLWNQFSSYSLSVIPLYILMGEIVFRTGITEKMFESAYKWVGHFRGGMASTTILASAGFASICGSNSATAATMGTMALPELDKYKYDKALSTGSVATGGTLGIIIPPSTVLIVLALQMEVSVRELFVASIIPGIFLTTLLIATVVYLCVKSPTLGPAGEKSSMKDRLLSLVGVIPVAGLFVFVIGGLFFGFFTPTESGAFGAFGAIVISLVMGKMTKGNFLEAMAGTLRSSAMVLMLVVGAMVFGRFLTVTRLPYAVAEWVTNLPVAPIFVLIAILIVYVIGGSIMDALGFLIISIPIFYPTVIALGYDPIWFAVLLCVVTSMGAITPPVGVNVFVVQGLTKETPITTVFKGASYFLVAYIAFIALLITFPQIILFLI
ncbi:C4-dicarboxylate ABC transporter permease [Sporosarcina sp. P12(2017)]|uniref:TRAP transporter large permease n=1 Tax=unclassified Sporosarcina TaxID=2647733 RepID=UPI000C163F97|nr:MULTISPECIES: TRAP transporter large permease [unclassified Sporosarcina]PIC55989.1 C4-dicarboxylate ABC transporter permease [Sporosarcina sp. P10]PIC59598.1 C4-dicarboxylate ABC transporter permease [Sporosarcina sp. P12(2017)]